MIEFRLLKCNWVQYNNIACGTLIGMCQILRDQGIPDQAWEMHQSQGQFRGDILFSSGTSIYAIAAVGIPTEYYAPDYLWPNIPDDDFDA